MQSFQIKEAQTALLLLLKPRFDKYETVDGWWLVMNKPSSLRRFVPFPHAWLYKSVTRARGRGGRVGASSRVTYHLGETFWIRSELWEACLDTPLKTLSAA